VQPGGLFLGRLKDAGDPEKESLPAAIDEMPWRVSTELAFRGGRLDIGLEAPGIILAVENKVEADDGQRQLERYWHYGQSRGLDRTSCLRPCKGTCSG